MPQNRKTREQHLLEGNPSDLTEMELNHLEGVSVPAGAIDPPTWLTDRARAEWDRLAPVAKEMNVLTVADVATFAMLCQRLGNHHEATAATGACPGVEAKIKLWRAARQEAEQALKLTSQFGLTPIARQRLNAEAPQKIDEAEQFLFGERGKG